MSDIANRVNGQAPTRHRQGTDKAPAKHQ